MTDAETAVEPAARPSRAPGILLVASGVLAVVALLIPGTWSAITATAQDAVGVMHGLRDGYQLSSVLWAIAGIVALLGLQVWGATFGGRLATAAANVTSAGVLIWISSTVTASTNTLMTDAQGGTSSDVSYLVLGELGHVLRLTAFLTIAAGFALLTVALHEPTRLGRAGAWTCILLAVVLAVLAVLRQDVALTIALPVALLALGGLSLRPDASYTGVAVTARRAELPR
jgi:hypothetical protein